MRGRLPHPRKKGGASTGPSPFDRRKTGSKHHLICDGRGTPLYVVTTAANVNDITQTIVLVDGCPVGRRTAGSSPPTPRRPDAVFGDKAYDSKVIRRELRKLRIMPVISRKGAPEYQGPGQTPVRRRADLRPAPPVQTPRRPMGTPPRPSRRLRLVGLRPDLLEATQEGPLMNVARALTSRRSRARA
ncbi:transposase [Streptomyces sp. SDT5-1]|uniref:transposase n=1 Tax=Streptomyces sp. SDT5-1 TaxID=3406418 RepID=UPI003FD08429